ncbi:MAG: hypothetical protein JNL83_15165 [Myxococcales bacterium]|nr:hypothetical protein [Myxococcales bacterium]
MHDVRITVAIAKALGKSVAVAAVIAILSLALWRLDPLLAMLFLVAGSAVPMLRAYRAPWPVTTLTCAVPAVAALACYAAQLALLPSARGDASLGLGIPIGVLAGWLSARAHHLEERAGQVYARRTAGHLVIWLVTVVVAEGGALWGSDLVVRAGLTGGAFAIAMVLAFETTLRARSARTRSRTNRRVTAQASLLLLAILAAGTRVASAEPLPAGTYAGDADPAWLATVNTTGAPPVATATRARVRINTDGTAELLDRVEFRYGTAVAFVFEPAPPPAPGARGIGRVVVTEIEPRGDGRERRTTTTRDFTIDLTPRPDGSYLLWLPNPVWVRAPGGGVAFMTQRCPWVIRGGDAAVGSPRDTTDAMVQVATAYAQFTQQLAQVRSRLTHRGLSDDAVKAGIVAALLLLLAGATAQTASAMALAVATRRAEEQRPPGEPTIAGPGRRILSGREAREWLASHGLARDDRLTPEFWYGWYNRPWSEADAPPPFGLVAMAGRWGRKDVLGDDLTIVIDLEPPDELPPRDESPPPEESPPPPRRRTWPERHEPPRVKVPCINERLHFKAEQRTVTALHHELQRLDEEIEHLEEEWNTARKTGLWNGLIDVAFLAVSAWRLIAGAPLTAAEPFADLWAKKVGPAIAEGLIKEALKLGVRLGHGDRAELEKLLKSLYPNGGTKAGIIETLKEFLIGRGAPPATAELAAKTTSSVWSGVTGGMGVYGAMQKCEHLRARRRHAQALRRDTKLEIMDAEERRDIARARLRTCTQDTAAARGAT